MARCIVCGRTLKNPKYAKISIGPVCLKKREEGNMQYSINDNDTEYVAYDGGDIVLKRKGAYQKTVNVPRLLVIHSPAGFEWGYAGSGPADLALNILLICCCTRFEAELWHQDFKSKFIVNVPKEGGIIHKAKIMNYIDQQRLKQLRDEE